MEFDRFFQDKYLGILDEFGGHVFSGFYIEVPGLLEAFFTCCNCRGWREGEINISGKIEITEQKGNFVT